MLKKHLLTIIVATAMGGISILNLGGSNIERNYIKNTVLLTSYKTSQHSEFNIENSLKDIYTTTYGYVLNGNINNIVIPKNVKKILTIKDSNGNILYNEVVTNLNWYDGANNYNGYQAIIVSKNLKSLSTLKNYKMYISFEINGENYQIPITDNHISMPKNNLLGFEITTNLKKNLNLSTGDSIKNTSIVKSSYKTSYGYVINVSNNFQNKFIAKNSLTDLVIKNSNGNVIRRVNGVNTNWYSLNNYAGTQFILPNSILELLQNKGYSYQIENGDDSNNINLYKDILILSDHNSLNKNNNEKKALNILKNSYYVEGTINNKGIRILSNSYINNIGKNEIETKMYYDDNPTNLLTLIIKILPNNKAVFQICNKKNNIDASMMANFIDNKDGTYSYSSNNMYIIMSNYGITNGFNFGGEPILYITTENKDNMIMYVNQYGYYTKKNKSSEQLKVNPEITLINIKNPKIIYKCNLISDSQGQYHTKISVLNKKGEMIGLFSLHTYVGNLGDNFVGIYKNLKTGNITNVNIQALNNYEN